MKKIKFSVYLLFLLASSMYFNSSVQALSLQGTEHGHNGDGMLMECMNPSQNFTIATTADSLAFDKSKLEVPKNACIGVMFMNKQTIEHNFVLDNDEGHEWVHIHINDSSTVVHEGMPAGSGMAFIMTPDEDITLPFYCSVQAGSHRNVGMEGDFVIGEGSEEEDSPGFTTMLSIFSVSLLAIVVAKKRKSQL